LSNVVAALLGVRLHIVDDTGRGRRFRLRSYI